MAGGPAWDNGLIYIITDRGLLFLCYLSIMDKRLSSEYYYIWCMPEKTIYI